MSTNSPAQFVPSTPKFGYNTDDAHACSSPVAVVPSMQRSLDRTIGKYSGTCRLLDNL